MLSNIALLIYYFHYITVIYISFGFIWYYVSDYLRDDIIDIDMIIMIDRNDIDTSKASGMQPHAFTYYYYIHHYRAALSLSAHAIYKKKLRSVAAQESNI